MPDYIVLLALDNKFMMHVRVHCMLQEKKRNFYY